MYISLNRAKQQINAEYGECLHEDGYIEYLAEVAESTVERDTGIKLNELENERGEIPTPLFHAAMLLIAHYYGSREPVVFGVTPSNVPLAYWHLISTFKKNPL
ncbi:MAG: head-tail connector protein [Prevotellaceae bacterium]|jgi:hypothetical protein|nr:head-tail connector protein [Prevotellaceae bacterium]